MKGEEKPVADEDRRYLIHYLEAPLFKRKFGELFAAVNGWHGGLSFVDEEDETNMFDVEFYADTSVMGAVMPEAKVNDEGVPELVWNNGATAHVRTSPQTDYWTKDLVIGSISGAQLNVWLKWLSEYNQHSGFYALWQIDTPENKTLQQSHNCYDWVVNALAKLKEVGAEFLEEAQPKRNYISLIVSEATKVSYNCPDTKPQILEFFNQIKNLRALKDTKKENIDVNSITEFFKSWSHEGAFVFHRDSYYKVCLTPPYFSMTYDSFQW
eukprot:CAMPEP_0174261248 /NCGR_PEP_ID=MMETSP0439-20130205/11325_1 /TAXON_ID=0 /ORGANISM="Stereomyxa ramosa, Strain Chinc5" /LENGTH=267 /DNA_ID=CAMNT_0015345701 /DNA_START=6 /DNA_END=806 /DNA_ORIENTATION=+